MHCSGQTSGRSSYSGSEGWQCCFSPLQSDQQLFAKPITGTLPDGTLHQQYCHHAAETSVCCSSSSVQPACATPDIPAENKVCFEQSLLCWTSQPCKLLLLLTFLGLGRVSLEERPYMIACSQQLKPCMDCATTVHHCHRKTCGQICDYKGLPFTLLTLYTYAGCGPGEPSLGTALWQSCYTKRCRGIVRLGEELVSSTAGNQRRLRPDSAICAQCSPADCRGKSHSAIVHALLQKNSRIINVTQFLHPHPYALQAKMMASAGNASQHGIWCAGYTGKSVRQPLWIRHGQSGHSESDLSPNSSEQRLGSSPSCCNQPSAAGYARCPDSTVRQCEQMARSRYICQADLALLWSMLAAQVT